MISIPVFRREDIENLISAITDNLTEMKIVILKSVELQESLSFVQTGYRAQVHEFKFESIQKTNVLQKNLKLYYERNNYTRHPLPMF